MLPPSSSRTITMTLSASSGPVLRDSFNSQASAPTVASAPSSTNVSSPLTLERPTRLGLRGGCGGGSGLARAAEQAHARLGSLAIAGIEFAAHVVCRYRTAAVDSQVPSPRGAGRAGSQARAKFSRRRDAGKQRIAAGLRSVHSAENERRVGAAESKRVGQRRVDRT